MNNQTPQPVQQTTGTSDNPNCACCNPVQPLEPPVAGDNLWTCPVTSKKYMYDPAEGVAREVNPTVNRQAVEAPDFFPQAPGLDEARQVDPRKGFA